MNVCKISKICALVGISGWGVCLSVVKKKINQRPKKIHKDFFLNRTTCREGKEENARKTAPSKAAP